MLGFWSVRLRADPWRFLALRKRMRSGDRPGLQNRRVAGNPVTGGFDPHSLPPFHGNAGAKLILQHDQHAGWEISSHWPSPVRKHLIADHLEIRQQRPSK